jgi:hypothetical protein
VEDKTDEQEVRAESKLTNPMASTSLLARSTTAEKYQPQRTQILFVAESPPLSVDRYFYFENVKGHDWLWIALMKALYPSEWAGTKIERQRKAYWLTKFQKSTMCLPVADRLVGTGGQRDLARKVGRPDCGSVSSPAGSVGRLGGNTRQTLQLLLRTGLMRFQYLCPP